MRNYNTALFADTVSNHNQKPLIGLVSRITTITEQKIGTMLSTYILSKDIEPTEAVRLGLDDTSCANCGNRPSEAKYNPDKPVCYVRTWQGAGKTWGSYNKGNVGELADFQKALMQKRGLRMGSYGDPTMVPLELWKPLLETTDFHTGYTSMWREEYAQEYKGLLQASCTSVEEQKQAVENGWTGTYTTYPLSVDLDTVPGIVCPNLRDKSIKCSDCKLCDGKHHIKNTDHGLPYKTRK